MRKIKVLCHTFHPVAFDGLICSLCTSYPNGSPWLLGRAVSERKMEASIFIFLNYASLKSA